MKDTLRTGDFLSDVDIEIIIRSGQTDLSELQKLMNAIVASSTSLVNTKIVLTESEHKIKINYDKKLTTLRVFLQI